MSGSPQSHHDAVRSRREFLHRGGATLATLGGIGSIALAGCAAGGTPERVTVEMTDELVFDPESVTVASGGTVRWTNVGRIDHTVTAYADRIPAGADYFASGGFDTEAAARRNLSPGLIGPDETYEHTVDVPGTYEYFCVPHERSPMIGSFTVD